MKANVVNVKKVTAVVIAFLMMILSVVYANSKSEAVNTSRKYRIFNAKTGVQIGDDYTLNALKSEDNSRTVIGDDERVVDWTKSGVVKIITTSGSFGSGFVVSDHVIATAAHCVYEYSKINPKPQKISKILLFDTNGNVTLEATPVEYHVPYKYICDSMAYFLYDYALITVKEDLSAYACFNLGVPLNNFIDNKPVVTVTGFPATIGTGDNEKRVNTATEHMMYSGNGIVSKLSSSLINYTADTTGGNSGGPVYITESAYGETYYTVVAIHVRSSREGTRMTTDLIHFYSSNNTHINW